MVKSAPPARWGPARHNQWPGRSVWNDSNEDALDRWTARRFPCDDGCGVCQLRGRLALIRRAYRRRSAGGT